MAIFSSTAVQCGYFRTNYVMPASVYVGQIYFLQISELASMKQPKDSLQLAKPTRNSRKIANKLKGLRHGNFADFWSKLSGISGRQSNPCKMLSLNI